MTEEISFAEFWDLFWPSITAAIVAAVLCGLLGFFVVTRRIAFVSAALGQVAGLGVAFGFLLGSHFGVDPHGETPLYLDPVIIALGLCAAVAAVLSRTSRVQRTTPESTVAFVYLTAAALALIVLSSPRIVQEAHEVTDLLFGSTVAVRNEHLIELVVAAGMVVVSFAVLFKDLVFVSFDPEMARACGYPVRALDFWLHLSVGVSVAVATRAIGALPVFGFLVLPAGAALLLTQSLAGAVWLSILGAVFAAGLGFYASFLYSLPAGPVMVACAAAFWPVAAGVHLARKRLTRR